jgi:hypothetical protein
MNKEINPNSMMTYEINKNNTNIPYRDALIQQDILSNLKNQLFVKNQNRKNYVSLLAKYGKLQEDLEKLIQMRNQQEIILRQQQNDERNILINELKNKNYDLSNQLNEQITMNTKLYNENNILFKELESIKNENKELHETIIKQEDFLHRLSYEKEEIEKKIYDLSQMREKQEIEIMNRSEEINEFNHVNIGQDDLIRSRDGENINIFKEINNEKKIKENLIYELRDKENMIKSNQQKLNMVNENINGLKNDINNLTNILSKNNDDIDIVNCNILKEIESTNQLLTDNNNLNNNIHDRDILIQNLNNENDSLKNNNQDLEQDNINANASIEEYKKHLIFLVFQNKKLAAEIQLLLGRDTDIKNVLERTNYLKEFRQENDRRISNSIENLKPNLDTSYQLDTNSDNNNVNDNDKSSYSINKNENEIKNTENENNEEPNDIKEDKINEKEKNNINENINENKDNINTSKEKIIENIIEDNDNNKNEEQDENNVNNNDNNTNIDENKEERSEK